MNFERSAARSRQVSMLALINVIFVLLTFFLIAGTIEKFEIIPVDVPIARNSKLIDEGPIVIVLGRHEEVLVGEDLVTPDQVTPLLRGLLKDRPERVITIKADGTLSAVTLIDTLDRVKAAGGRNVSLATQSPVSGTP